MTIATMIMIIHNYDTNNGNIDYVDNDNDNNDDDDDDDDNGDDEDVDIITMIIIIEMIIICIIVNSNHFEPISSVPSTQFLTLYF